MIHRKSFRLTGKVKWAKFPPSNCKTALLKTSKKVLTVEVKQRTQQLSTCTGWQKMSYPQGQKIQQPYQNIRQHSLCLDQVRTSPRVPKIRKKKKHHHTVSSHNCYYYLLDLCEGSKMAKHSYDKVWQNNNEKQSMEWHNSNTKYLAVSCGHAVLTNLSIETNCLM